MLVVEMKGCIKAAVPKMNASSGAQAEHLQSQAVEAPVAMRCMRWHAREQDHHIWLCRDVQAAAKGFKKVICFESSPVNHEATKTAAKEQEVQSRM